LLTTVHNALHNIEELVCSIEEVIIPFHFISFHNSYTVKMNMLYLNNRTVATDLKQYY